MGDASSWETRRTLTLMPLRAVMKDLSALL